MKKIMKRLVPGLVISFVLATMIRVHLPMDKPFFKFIYHPVDKVQNFIGLNQTWFMFSPNPSRIDAYVVAEIEFEDGSSEIFDFYKGHDHSMIQKYLFGEKYRKFTSENLRQDDKKFLWKDAARFAIRKIKSRTGYKIPVGVRLTRYWSQTPDWKQSFVKHIENKTDYQKFTFYKLEVN